MKYRLLPCTSKRSLVFIASKCKFLIMYPAYMSVEGVWHDVWLCCCLQLAVPIGHFPLPFP